MRKDRGRLEQIADEMQYMMNRGGPILVSPDADVKIIDLRPQIDYLVSLLEKPGLDERNRQLINDNIAQLLKKLNSPTFIIKSDYL